MPVLLLIQNLVPYQSVSQPKAKGFIFPHHKASTSTLGSIGTSTTSLLRQRPSDTLSVDSIQSYGDTLKPNDVGSRKPSSSPLTRIGNLIKKRSKSALRSGAMQIDSSARPAVPPLPSPDLYDSLNSRKSRKEWKKKISNAPPPPPPLPPKESEFMLDTNLDKMDGIIDLNLTLNAGDPGSPSSGSGGFDMSCGASTILGSDVSSFNLDFNLSPAFSNPFQPTSVSGIKPKPYSNGHVYDGRKVSPTSHPPPFRSISSVDHHSIEGADSPSWTPPESWAVEKEGNDDTDGDSSSDESVPNNHHDRPTSSTQTRKRKARQSRAPRGRDNDAMYKVRIYRANNSYHVVSIDLSVTVGDLTPQLNKKLLLREDAEVHRLYLKERGRGMITIKPDLVFSGLIYFTIRRTSTSSH